MTADIGKSIEAKAALRQVLAVNNGNTKDPAVIAAIENLQAVNSETAPARNHTLMDGTWLLMSAPNFPGGELLPSGKFAYTLGRLAFNMFEPTGLKLVIDRVLQPVFPVGNGEQRTHNIVVEFTTIDDSLPQISGVVHNLGVCQAISDTVLQVKFTGGVLAPQNPNQINDWQAVFSQQSQPKKRTFKESLMSFVLRLMFGLVPPQGMNPTTGEIAFTMERSPKGRLSILYLDEELRITRGEKGTILVCERMN